MAQAPNFIETNPTILRQVVFDTFEQVSGRTLRPAQAESLMLEVLASVFITFSNRVQLAAEQNLVDFSTGAALEELGRIFGVERLGASPAKTTVRFYFNTPHAALMLPINTRVSTQDQTAVFATPTDTVVAANVEYIDVEVIAVTSGAALNGRLAGQVNTILDPLPYLTSVTNLNDTAGGSEVEEDQALRDRIVLASGKFSTAGPSDAYKYHTLSANSSIISAGVVSTFQTPGQVYVYPLMEDGSLTPPQVINSVQAALNSEKVRPLTDTVHVLMPNRIDLSLTINLTLYNTADPSIVTQQVMSNLTDYFIWLRSGLGRDVVPAQIIQAARVDGVYDVDLNGFNSRLIVDNTSFVYGLAPTINIIGFTNG